MQKSTNCPVCRLEIEKNLADPYFPFCSSKCQKRDLGNWALEKYSIPTQVTSEDEVAELLISEEELEQEN